MISYIGNNLFLVQAYSPQYSVWCPVFCYMLLKFHVQPLQPGLATPRPLHATMRAYHKILISEPCTVLGPPGGCTLRWFLSTKSCANCSQWPLPVWCLYLRLTNLTCPSRSFPPLHWFSPLLLDEAFSVAHSQPCVWVLSGFMNSPRHRWEAMEAMAFV